MLTISSKGAGRCKEEVGPRASNTNTTRTEHRTEQRIRGSKYASVQPHLLLFSKLPSLHTKPPTPPSLKAGPPSLYVSHNPSSPSFFPLHTVQQQTATEARLLPMACLKDPDGTNPPGLATSGASQQDRDKPGPSTRRKSTWQKGAVEEAGEDRSKSPKAEKRVGQERQVRRIKDPERPPGVQACHSFWLWLGSAWVSKMSVPGKEWGDIAWQQ